MSVLLINALPIISHGLLTPSVSLTKIGLPSLLLHGKSSLNFC